MVLACHTASQVLGIDCQCGSPRQAAKPMARAPTTTPAAAVRAGHIDTGGVSGVRSRNRASRTRKPSTIAVTTTRAASAVSPFQGTPRAPNGMMATPTTPYVNAGPTAIANGQRNRPARATMAPGRVSNKTAIRTPSPKFTGLVWLPR